MMSRGGRDTFFLHKDANGSVRSITNVSGTEVKCYHYDPFGNIVAVTGSDTGNTRNTRRYAGRDWDDETDLVYMVARFYDPRFGRFTSPDPEPTIMSPYTYVLNNPVSFTDPTGHAARCGGAYSIDFSSTTWRLIMYGAFLWRQWPETQYVHPAENAFDPADPISWLFSSYYRGILEVTMTNDLIYNMRYTAWHTKLELQAEANNRMAAAEYRRTHPWKVTNQMVRRIYRWLDKNIPEFKELVRNPQFGLFGAKGLFAEAGYSTSFMVLPGLEHDDVRMPVHTYGTTLPNPVILIPEIWSQYECPTEEALMAELQRRFSTRK